MMLISFPSGFFRQVIEKFFGRDRVVKPDDRDGLIDSARSRPKNFSIT